MLKYLISVSFFVIASIFCFGQQNLSSSSKKAIKLYQEALDMAKTRKHKSANELLDKALEKDPNFIECYLLKADLYTINQELELAADSYLKALKINPDFFPYLSYNLADLQYQLGEYNEAYNNFKLFIDKGKGKEQTIEKARTFADKCLYAINLINNPVSFHPKMLSANVNRFYDQYFPSFSIDGKTMIFTVLEPDSTAITNRGYVPYQEDFYYSTDSAGEWTVAKPLPGNINSLHNEGAQQISADGKTLVFTGCNRRDGLGMCDLYFSYLDNNGHWTKPVNAGSVINSRFSEKQPALSPDGRVLYFSSNRSGGYGGMDLYYSVKSDSGKWQTPVHLDSVINTEGDDVCPFMHQDNRTLYFSSDGHMGMGMKDIFITRRIKNQFEKPKNLGYPINTHGDEISLVVSPDGQTAYYAGDNEKRRRVIYSFQLPEELKPQPASYVRGTVSDALSGKLLQAKVQLFLQNSTDTLMQVNSSSTNGQFLISLPIGSNYALHAKAPSYLFYSGQFNLDSVTSVNSPYELIIKLIPIKIGEKIILHNIFFSTNDFHLDEKSNAELNQLYRFLEENKNIRIEIGGHTDNQGSKEYNLQLSEKRAKEVYQYLIEKGIASENISFKGYGMEQPIATNDTPNGQAKNRRTEIKITGSKQ